MTRANGPSRGDIIAVTRSWLGAPYLHQASQKGVGTDCLGLVRGVWRELYGEEPEFPPPYTPDWSERHWSGQQGAEPLKRAAEKYLEPQAAGGQLPGNVVLFRVVPRGPAKHIGILSDHDRFIHAYAGREVTESWLSRWWQARIVGLYAFPGVPS